MLLFGGSLQQLEILKCDGLNMTRETFNVAGCNITVENRNCSTSWSATYNQYVCECDRYVTGASGAGC
jgi:hypothetical protein